MINKNKMIDLVRQYNALVGEAEAICTNLEALSLSIACCRDTVNSIDDLSLRMSTRYYAERIDDIKEDALHILDDLSETAEMVTIMGICQDEDGDNR